MRIKNIYSMTRTIFNLICLSANFQLPTIPGFRMQLQDAYLFYSGGKVGEVLICFSCSIVRTNRHILFIVKSKCTDMRRSTVLLIGGIIFSSEIVWHFYKRFHFPWFKTRKCKATSRTNDREQKQSISEVMFFSKESSLCRGHFTNEETCLRDCCPVVQLRRLESYINRSEESLDVCMYALTCQLLSNAIVNAHKRGVCVRIITDHRMACNDAAQTALFHNNGVAIRFENFDVLMHHKFVIVDNALIITGSINWTMTAFFGNFENVLVTNQRALVEPFVEEFDRLWKTFSKTHENVEHFTKPPANDTS